MTTWQYSVILTSESELKPDLSNQEIAAKLIDALFPVGATVNFHEQTLLVLVPKVEQAPRGPLTGEKDWF